MSARLTISFILLSAFSTSVFASDLDTSFCAQLRKDGVLSGQQYGLFYKNSNGVNVQINDGDSVSQDVDAFYYYIRATEFQFGHPSVLNIKSVFKTSGTIKNNRYVYVRNNKWKTYTDSQQQQISRDCSEVDPEGYEAFHLSNGRNYCLRRHFHQTTPFDTLATPDRQASFAFNDMLPARPSVLSTIWNLVTPGPAAASTRDALGEASISHIRSKIKNFTFTANQDNCIRIGQDIPRDIDRLSLRITYLGTSISSFPVDRSWQLKIVK